MAVALRHQWQMTDPGGDGPEPVLFTLLERVEATGPLRQAALGIGLSYRHAWALMGRWSAAMGQPLLNMESFLL